LKPKSRPSSYRKVELLSLIYNRLTGYEKNFVKRIIQYGNPKDLYEELTEKQFKYISILYNEKQRQIEARIKKIEATNKESGE